MQTVLLGPWTGPSLLVVCKVQVTGQCSKWICKSFLTIYNKTLRTAFLFSGPTTATYWGPSSRHTPTKVHLFPVVDPKNPQYSWWVLPQAAAPFQMHKLLMLLLEVNQTLKIKFGFIHTSKRIAKIKADN